MKNAELNKRQRAEIFALWKSIDSYLKEKNFQDLNSFVHGCPEGLTVNQFDIVRNYVVASAFPWEFSFSYNPYAKRVMIHTEVLYLNPKTGKWEETDFTGY